MYNYILLDSSVNNEWKFIVIMLLKLVSKIIKKRKKECYDNEQSSGGTCEVKIKSVGNEKLNDFLRLPN